MNETIKYRLKLRPKIEPKFTSLHFLTDSPISLNPHIFPSFFIKVPEILSKMSINWNEISDNLGIEISNDNLVELEYCLNKCIYSDKEFTYSKNFGIKTINLYDLGLTSINQINDHDLVVDKCGFGFSRFDLKRLTKTCQHPYLGAAEKLSDTNILSYLCSDCHRSVNLFDYFENDFYNSLRSESTYSLTSDSTIETEDVYKLEQIFGKIINHDFYTDNLVNLYRDKHNNNSVNLDYTVTLLYYIIGIIDDFSDKFRDYLINNYFKGEDELKYSNFLRNYIHFLRNIKENYNLEKFQYVCIIIVKILQYRYTQIHDSDDLFQLLKPYFNPTKLQELYHSVAIDRVNYLYNQRTGKFSLINISIDNIFSNAEFSQHYYTLMLYLHTKYMNLPSKENGTICKFLNHYKPLDNYNYLDLLQYFTDMAYFVSSPNQSESLKHRFHNMIKRYYLKKDYMGVNKDGSIYD